MTAMEAWNNLRRRLDYAAKCARADFGGKGFTKEDTTADVMAFVALREAEKGRQGACEDILQGFTMEEIKQLAEARRRGYEIRLVMRKPHTCGECGMFAPECGRRSFICPVKNRRVYQSSKKCRAMIAK